MSICAMPKIKHVPQKAPDLEINLGRLPIAFRKPVWAWMQKNQPAVCEFIGGEQCKMIRSEMHAYPMLSLHPSEAVKIFKQVPGLERFVQ